MPVPEGASTSVTPSPSVVLVVSSLVCGGAERIAAGMATWWSAAGRKVQLITFYGPERDFFKLPPCIKRTSLGLRHAPRSSLHAALDMLRMRRRLYDALSNLQPRIVVSHLARVNLVAIPVCRRLGIPLIIVEQNDPRHRRYGYGVDAVRRHRYRQAARLVVLTQAVRECWAERYVPASRIRVLPNFVVSGPQPSCCAMPESLPARFIVATGRLVPQKGFDLLLQAFVEVRRQHRDTHLVILGEGPEREALEAQRLRLDLEAVVHMPGAVEAPEAYFRAAQCFVLSSRYEGFGIVIVEAMKAGLPVVSFDCPSGPNEIITQGVEGYLVPPNNARALGRTLAALIGDPARCQAMRAAALRRAADFMPDTVMPRWDALIDEVLA